MRTDSRKPWKLLIDHNMTQSELRLKAGISSVILAKLGKGESVTTGILLRVCKVLNCNIGDIVEINYTNDNHVSEAVNNHQQQSLKEATYEL